MANHVVDEFEAIQVKEHDTKVLPVTPPLSQGRGEPVPEERPIGEPRKAVVIGHVLDPTLRLPAFSDIH